MPRASIVMPLYNKAAYVQKTIGSVLHQSEGDFELLVIDDGSTDDGPSVARAVNDSRVRVHGFPNGGVSLARNRGIELATSDTVAFLDADDSWEPGFLSSMLAALGRHPEAVAAFCNISEDSATRTCLPDFAHETVIDDYPAWFVTYRGLGLWSSNTVARKRALLECGLFPVGVHNGEDTDTWFRLSFLGPVVYEPEVLARYSTDDAGSLSKRFSAVRPVVIDTLEHRLGASGPVLPNKSSLRTAISYFWLAYGVALAQGGKRTQAVRAMSKARPSMALVRQYLRSAYALLFGK